MNKKTHKRLDFGQIILLISLLFLMVYGIGYIFDRRLYTVIFHDDFSDAFMDFFNSASHAIGRTPYKLKAIYPPLCYVIYWIFAILMGNDAMVLMEQHEEHQVELLTMAQPMMIFLLYFTVTLLIFLILGFRMINRNKLEKVLLLISICFSAPFLFQFERANIIFVSLLGSMGFFLWKDSENRKLRELSLLCLAFSAALKIYPAIFGILLVKEKRYKETIRLIIYGILFFFVPFLFIRGGLKNIPLFIKNLLYTSTIDQASRDGYKLSFSASISYILQRFSINALLSENIAKKIAFFIGISSFVTFWYQNSVWKSVLLLSCLLIGIPNMSYNYTAIFLCIPFILFLNSKPSLKDKWIYGILFLLMLFPLPFGGWFDHNGLVLYHACNRSFNTLQISFSILIAIIILNIEGMYCISRNILEHKKFVQYILFLFVYIGILLGLIVVGNKSYQVSKQTKKTITKNGELKNQYIWFNNSSYHGTYRGILKNKKPYGKGTFYPQDDSAIESINAVWNGEVVNGSVIIKYKDDTSQKINCNNSEIYGYVTTFDENNNLVDCSWYWNGRYLMDSLRSAITATPEEMIKEYAMNTSTIYEISGNVLKSTYGKHEAKLIIEDNKGITYHFSYDYSNEAYLEYIYSPILNEGDTVTCYGNISDIKKGQIYLSLISAGIKDNNGNMIVANMNESYKDIAKYPCEYENKSCKISGQITDIQYDYSGNNILEIINSENNYYVIKYAASEELSREYDMPQDEKRKIMDKICTMLPTIGEKVTITGRYQGVYPLDTDTTSQIVPLIAVDDLKGHEQ